MSDLLTVFVNNLLPILLVAGAGVALAHFLGLESRPLSLLTFNALGPCLVFNVITHSDVPGDEVLRMAGFTAATVLIPAVLAASLAWLLRLNRRLAASLVVTTLLINAGNYGLSVVDLAFGEIALAQAAVFFAVAVALTWTLGVAVASMGNTDLGTALRGVLKVPPLYAVLLAVVFMVMDWQLPPVLDRPVALLSQAAIPVMLLLLGVQLYHNWRVGSGRYVPLAVVLRLLVGPAIALLLVPIFGLTGPARQAGLVQAAMPTAVVTTVLAETYGLESAFVTRVVVVTTLLSPLTLTPLLAWLGG